MKHFSLFICVFACLRFCTFSFAQQIKNDSLETLVHTGNNLQQTDLLFQLARQYWDSNKDSAAFYLNIVLKTSDYEAIAKANQYLGHLYLEQGNYSEALKNYLAAVSYYEKTDKIQVANIYSRIGEIWRLQLDFEKSLSYHQSAFSIYTELNDSVGTAYSLNDIALTYEAKKDFETALSYHEKSLEIKKNLGDKRMLGDSYCNLGTIYRELGQYEKALEYQYMALKIDQELGDEVNMAIIHNNIAALLILMEKPNDALPHLQTAEKLTQLHHALDPLKYTYLQYTRLFEKKNDYQQAYQYHLKYSAVKDSLFNSESSKQITEMSTKYETEKKETRIKLQQTELDKKHAEVKRQNTQRNAFIGGFNLMLALAGVTYHSYRNKRKAHGLLETKNHIIEEKNKDITDSINYARTIQQAILPFDHCIAAALKEYFVLFKPRDIVSGDFYWFTEKDNYVFLAVADCTGHGVPGAFMSMIGSATLTHAVSEKGLTEPGKILSESNRKIKEALKQTENKNRDGMDISLLRFEKNNLNKIQFAGAMRTLYHINGQLNEVKGDKLAIGGTTDDSFQYTNHELTLQKGDTLYISSDGYADQFGGSDGKKFRTGNLKKLLLSIRDKPMDEQKKILDEAFETWKDTLVQVDDVCIIGVRV